MQYGDVIRWSDGEADLSTDHIDIWYAEDSAITDSQLLQQYRDILGSEEKARLAKFRFPERKHQYLISQALIRSVLTLYASAVLPEKWEFKSNEFGKPFILNSEYQEIKFNLTHADGIIALAVVVQIDIGIDIESIDRDADNIDRVARYFSEKEYQELKLLSGVAQANRFNDLWTLKEAYSKACGMGLTIPLNHSNFSFDEEGKIDVDFHSERKDHPKSWRFWQLRCTPQHQIAVALKTASEVRAIKVRKAVPFRQYEELEFDVLRRSR